MTNINYTAITDKNSNYNQAKSAPRANGRSFIQILRDEFGLPTIITVVIIMIATAALGNPWVMVAGFMAYGLSIAGVEHIKEKRFHKKLEQFAKDNNWQFKGELPSKVANAVAFGIGANSSSNSIMTGVIGTNNFWFFDRFEIKSGSYVFVLQNDRSLPRALIRTTTPLTNGLTRKLEEESQELHGLKRISMEGSFDDYFYVYGDPGKHIDVLSFISPDVMQILMSNSVVTEIVLYNQYICLRTSNNLNDHVMNIIFELALKLVSKF